MTSIMVNIFDIDIDVLVERGVLAAHLRDNRDGIAQAVEQVLGLALPALAAGPRCRHAAHVALAP